MFSCIRTLLTPLSLSPLLPLLFPLDVLFFFFLPSLSSLVHLIRAFFSFLLSTVFVLLRMKFEDLLMERSEEKQKRQDLEEEVTKLQAELEGQQVLNRVLHCALDCPASSHQGLSSLIPPRVQALLSELAMVEEEIVWLEQKIKDMKWRLYQEKKHTQEWQMLQQPRRRRQPNRCIEYQAELREHEQPSKMHYLEEARMQKIIRQRRASVGSASDVLSISSTRSSEETVDKSIKHIGRSRYHDGMDWENGYIIEKPNELSEQLIKCLIRIFLESNRVSQDREGPNHVPKLTLACKNSKSSAKSSFGCKISPTFVDGYISSLDPYGVLLDGDGTFRDIGQYKSFIPITRSSLDIMHLQEGLPTIGKLRVLVHKLSSVDVSFLTYKQKLAFWINIYNACLMNAFLEHGLPSSQDKLLVLMNKAALNVGGIVLNALAIEHFILRHPCESKHGSMDEKEMLLRHAYGIGYPEPNVTFALCRGSWSSPALRVYTPEEVVNELGRAKVEYLEASVGITSKRKIVVPKLLQWHMRDFADDMESLLEWIYSHLPRSGALKRLMMECLNYDAKSHASKMVEIQPYQSEFRYMLAL